MAELVRVDSGRVPSVKSQILMFDSEAWADDKFGTGCKEEDDIEHPGECENRASKECELVRGEGVIIARKCVQGCSFAAE
jgi:hypothetical protein